MRKIDLKSVVWKEGNYYISQCLDVDVSSFGKTKKEALESLEEALQLHFEDTPISKVHKVEHPDLVPMTFRYA
jgi:predicted RNase H-like HicB family nuclease